MRKILLILCVFTVLFACSKKEKKSDVEDSFTGARYVRSATVVRGDIEKTLSYSGYVKYDQAMTIVPNISGKVEKIYVKEGENVVQGAVLARIDQNSLEQYEASFTLAEKNYIRSKNLLDDGVIDQRSYEETELMYLNAKTAYEFALENLEVKAPFSGVISAINLKENETYSPLMPQGLLRILNNNSIYVELFVSDRDISSLKVKQPARVSINEQNYEGFISFISPENDMLTGLNRIKIDFLKANSQLRNNQFASVELIPESRSNALMIPTEALIDGDTVITIQNGVAKRKKVVMGLQSRRHIEVLSGLEPGEKVIIEGNTGLEEGYPVIEL